MSMPAMQLLDPEDPLDPTLALSLGIELLRGIQRGDSSSLLRCYRPLPTVAFGGRDRHLPGFAAAVEAARDHGFTPVLRGPGGRAAAYHEGSLVVDHLEADPDFLARAQARFPLFAERFADALRSLDVDARVGEIPGEYCPGEFSINAAGTIKAVGTAQRVVRGAFLFSSSIIVEDPDPIRAVLTDVYAALEIDWNPATGGSISEVTPGITVEQVHEAVIAVWARDWTLQRSPLPAGALERAAEHLPRHDLSAVPAR